MKLKNKVAIITGASRGIGFAIAEAFLQEGAKVALCGSRLASAQKAADKQAAQYPEAQLLPLGVDMADSASIQEMVRATAAKWGGLDVLVNNCLLYTSRCV